MGRLVIDGFGQIELNNFAAPRDGRIEAQCKPDGTNFKSVPVENGMLLAVDNVTRTVSFPTNEELPVALVYSSEHQYDPVKAGLKNFKIELEDDFLPRLGYLSIGDKFTTNCISYDSSSDTGWTSDDKVKQAMTKEALKATPIYGGINKTDGSIKVSATKPSKGPVLRVIEGTTMPDGQFGVKFQVVKE